MMKGAVIAIACLASVSCTQAGSELIGEVSSEMRRCIAAYERETGKVLPVNVNRAYAHVSSDHVAVSFTHGDLGSFGQRSGDYESVLVCYVRRSSGEMRVLKENFRPYILGDDQTVIEYYNAVEPEFQNGEVVEMLFTKTDDRFAFTASQVLSLESLPEDAP